MMELQRFTPILHQFTLVAEECGNVCKIRMLSFVKLFYTKCSTGQAFASCVPCRPPTNNYMDGINIYVYHRLASLSASKTIPYLQSVIPGGGGGRVLALEMGRVHPRGGGGYSP